MHHMVVEATLHCKAQDSGGLPPRAPWRSGARRGAVISAVLRTTILHTTVPEAYRTRIASVQMATVEGGPLLAWQPGHG